jgi:DNA-binding transcriptional regulator YiaG
MSNRHHLGIALRQRSSKPFDPTFGKRGLALRSLEIRFRMLRLTQRQFAAKYGIGLGALRDLEQMRGISSCAGRTLIEAIALDPALIEKAARKAEQWGPK